MRTGLLTSAVKAFAAVALSAATLFGVMAPAQAGPFDVFAKPFETYLGSGANGQPKVPDFNFTRQDFHQNSELKAIGHLTKDLIVATVHGYTVTYNPKTDEVKVYGWVGGFSEAKEAKTYGADSSCFGTYGIETLVGGVPTCIPGSSVGTASTSPLKVLLSTTPGQERSCTWDPKSDGNDTHTC